MTPSSQPTATSPTFYWDIEGLGTSEQTLTVYDPDKNPIDSETRNGWTWKGDYPDAVADMMPMTLEALMALQQGNVERLDGPLPPIDDPNPSQQP